MVERFTGIDRAAAERTRAVAERLEFDLTQELGYRYPDFSDGRRPRDPPAHRDLRRTRSASATALATDCCKRSARARLESELALIDELGLAGFFLLHWEVLELAREVALEVRGRDSPRASCRRAAGGAARSARSSATSPVSRTSTRSRTTSRSAASSTAS